MTAAEAKQIAENATSKDQEDKVYKAIREAASLGFGNVYVRERIMPKMIERLKSEGYEVFERDVTFQQGGHYEYSCEISWL